MKRDLKYSKVSRTGAQLRIPADGPIDSPTYPLCIRVSKLDPARILIQRVTQINSLLTG